MIKVILAEDHNVVRNGIKTLLERSGGFKIVGEAVNGLEVLELLRKGTVPDILLSDINMDHMNGFELVKQVKKEFPEINSVFLTMLDNENFVSEAFDGGAQGYLLKNITSDELIFAIKHVNSNKQYICSELAMRLLERLSKIPSFSSSTTPSANADFSYKDLEVLELIAEGYTNIEIADKLFMSKRTVEGYRKSMLEKTGTRNSSSLIRFAIRNGLIN